MTITVRLKGFDNADLRRMRTSLPKILEEELRTWGAEMVALLQQEIRRNGFGLPDKKGGIPLIDTAAYVESFTAQVKKRTLTIWPDGANERMTHAELAELLEYGWSEHPPMPHLRPFEQHMLKKVPVLADRIMKRLKQ